jgi:hypothetical protein
MYRCEADVFAPAEGNFPGLTIFSHKFHFLPLSRTFVAAFRVTRVFFRAPVVFVLVAALG